LAKLHKALFLRAAVPYPPQVRATPLWLSGV
jgi:hypothetical protein